MTKQLLSPEIVEALHQSDSATISNAIERFKVRDPVTGYASLELKCQIPDPKPMVGYAITCTGDSTTPEDQRPLQIGDLLDAVHTAPKPGILVIKHVGHDRLRSCFVGDMFCSALQKLGVVGVVTDGGFRDPAGIRQRAAGFHVFSPGLVVSHGHGAFLNFGVTVSICSLTIRPGDLLHGDENGLLTVPVDIAEQVSQKAQVIRDAEGEYFDFLESDAFSFEALKQRIIIH